MPTIPKAERKVQRTALQTSQQSGASASAFGADIANGLNNVSNVITQTTLNEFAIQNETRAKEIDVEFSKSLRAMQYDPKNGYYSKRGEDAYKAQPMFEQATEELSKTFLERAENESQRSLLTKVMQQRVARARDGVTRHAQKEYNAWIDSASAARTEDSMQEAIVSYNDPAYVKQLRTTGRNEIVTTGERQGKDPEVINNELKQYDSNIHAGTVNHLIQISPKEARDYFEENKDEIDGRVQHKLLRALKISEKGDLATSREHYAQLSKMAAFTPEEFITEDLAKYELSDADFKRFSNAQVTAKRSKSSHDEKFSGIKRAMGLAANSLKGAGIKTTGKLTKNKAKQLEQFEGELFLDIEQFKTDNKRAPNDDEMFKIIDSLLIRGTVPGSGYVFDDEAMLFENKDAVVGIEDIPDDMKGRIIERYAKIYPGYTPTELEIQKSYTNLIRNNKVGK